ncbi:MAG: hypothetical protein KDD53_11550, partial [Bdellovibrionales bacterium]|nr:hypothetical protein [Bdellovibrionales bacterium]
MSHAEFVNIDIVAASKAEPIEFDKSLQVAFRLFALTGLGVFILGLLGASPGHFWAAYYTNLIFWMGLSVGGVIIAVIFRVVRAKWAPPVRRIAEANVSFLPWAWLLFLATYGGKEHLFYWGSKPMPGREFWMQPDFVYCRFSVLLGLLFFMLWRFVRCSLRGDVGIAREKAGAGSRWKHPEYNRLVAGWRGEKAEVARIEKKLAVFGPILIASYALIYSLFAFEMIMGMNAIFFSNMFGGFVFIGNILAGWASLSMMVLFLRSRNDAYSKIVGSQQLH